MLIFGSRFVSRTKKVAPEDDPASNLRHRQRIQLTTISSSGAEHEVQQPFGGKLILVMSVSPECNAHSRATTNRNRCEKKEPVLMDHLDLSCHGSPFISVFWNFAPGRSTRPYKSNKVDPHSKTHCAVWMAGEPKEQTTTENKDGHKYKS